MQAIETAACALLGLFVVPALSAEQAARFGAPYETNSFSPLDSAVRRVGGALPLARFPSPFPGERSPIGIQSGWDGVSEGVNRMQKKGENV
jgi:hypothetical protein